MIINTAEFIASNTDIKKCPQGKLPEYAFIGRSNVGKSSLINMLTNRKGLAKTSGTPGKTRLINHFKINDSWYIVDLPGYGYAQISKRGREELSSLIENYFLERTSLVNTFLLVDCRHKPQEIDMAFMEWLNSNELAFSIVFTKCDKLTDRVLKKSIKNYSQALLDSIWEELPPYFMTSSAKGMGRNNILDYIHSINKNHL